MVVASSLSEGTLEEVLSIQTSVGRQFRSESFGCVCIHVCECDVNNAQKRRRRHVCVPYFMNTTFWCMQQRRFHVSPF